MMTSCLIYKVIAYWIGYIFYTRLFLYPNENFQANTSTASCRKCTLFLHEPLFLLKLGQFSVGWVERKPTTKRYQHKEIYPFGDTSVAEKPRETQHTQLPRQAALSDTSEVGFHSRLQNNERLWVSPSFSLLERMGSAFNPTYVLSKGWG